MSAAKVTVTGIHSLDKKLKELTPRLGKLVLKQGVRKALYVMRKAIQAQCPVDTGLTRKSFVVRDVKKKKRGTIRMLVMITAKAKGLIKYYGPEKKRYFYPAGIEFGSRAKKANFLVRLFDSKAQVFGDGSIPPDPFVRRAYRGSGKAVMSVAMKDIYAGLEREAAKP